jgi:hypothetical protein
MVTGMSTFFPNIRDYSITKKETEYHITNIKYVVESDMCPDKMILAFKR